MGRQVKIECPNCEALIEPDHLHDAAYGLSGTHIHGSERFTCPKCNRTLTRQEAVSFGLTYVFDE